jgi:cation diffusion facilitator CzcD-associated flavoprotein CzcO
MQTVPHQQPASPSAADYTVVIIGSGFSGLCMGIALKKAGVTDFVILEKDTDFGGTWRVNTYPGAACDVPSHLYSFSFAQNAHWSRTFPTQPELLAYTERVATDHGMLAHIQQGRAFLGADFDETHGLWRVRTGRGDLTAKVLVSATGALSRPALPALRGINTFTGKVFHSAYWDHGYDLAGKRVAVVGTGASAIQFIPEIVKKVAQLDVFQRTPPWVLPRPDRAITAPEKWLLQHVKPLQWLYRGLNYVHYEMRFLAFAKIPALMKLFEMQAKRHIEKQIPHDAALRAKVTPSYTMGCKRILIMNSYYPALAQPHVAVFNDPIAEVRAHSIVLHGGKEREVDAIIFGTGFDVEHSMGTVEIKGRTGCLLSQSAHGGLEAYKGTALAGFPNFFMIIGPNTGLGHNSMVYMIESNVAYVLAAVLLIKAKQLHSVEVKPDVVRNFNATIQKRLSTTVWNSGCKSWYLAAGGKNNTLWPGFTFEYRKITKKFDAAAYTLL